MGKLLLNMRLAGWGRMLGGWPPDLEAWPPPLPAEEGGGAAEEEEEEEMEAALSPFLPDLGGLKPALWPLASMSLG